MLRWRDIRWLLVCVVAGCAGHHSPQRLKVIEADAAMFRKCVNDPSTFEGLTASAVLFDGRIELAPELATERGACGFYQSPATSCEDDCAAQQLGCGRNGTCGSWLPGWREDVRLTLSNGAGSQILDASGGVMHPSHARRCAERSARIRPLHGHVGLDSNTGANRWPRCDVPRPTGRAGERRC